MKPYYDHGGVTLYHADCRDVLDSAALFGPDGHGFVDHVVTDPPYSEHTHAKQRYGASGPPRRNGKGRVSPASFSRSADLGFASLSPELRAHCALMFAALARRWVLVFSDVEMCGEWRRDLGTAGLEYVRTGAWVKLGATPQFTGDRPAAGFEAVTVCHPRRKKRWNGGGSHAVWSVPIVQNRPGRGLRDTKGEGRWHTTPKPLALMQTLVSLFTDPGELVLDPFAGGGTTLLACRNLGRRAVGVEVDEGCCERVAKRLSQEVLPCSAPAALALEWQPQLVLSSGAALDGDGGDRRR